MITDDKNLGEKISWSAFEYEHKERSQDWFWALGIIIFASCSASIIFGNYFFAILLLLGGALFGFTATREPEVVNFELGALGLKINDRLYPYQNIKSFWVQKHPPGEEGVVRPTLFVRSERVFVPIISIPLEEPMLDKIHDIFLAHNVPEEEMQDHPSERIMEMLGF